jgi:ElaB/YqjD/DUF883 family membrane-anchored ribosome-binding protein
MHESLGDVMEDSRALLTASANATQYNVIHARRRLSESLKTPRETCASLSKTTARIAAPVREMTDASPFEAAGVAFGIGALIRFLMGRHR